MKKTRLQPRIRHLSDVRTRAALGIPGWLVRLWRSCLAAAQESISELRPDLQRFSSLLMAASLLLMLGRIVNSGWAGPASAVIAAGR